jgi:hypothetical protein
MQHSFPLIRISRSARLAFCIFRILSSSCQPCSHCRRPGACPAAAPTLAHDRTGDSAPFKHAVHRRMHWPCNFKCFTKLPHTIAVESEPITFERCDHRTRRSHAALASTPIRNGLTTNPRRLPMLHTCGVASPRLKLGGCAFRTLRPRRLCGTSELMHTSREKIITVLHVRRSHLHPHPTRHPADRTPATAISRHLPTPPHSPRTSSDRPPNMTTRRAARYPAATCICLVVIAIR